MRDLLPDQMEPLRRAESAFIATCRAWGYREIRTPAIEPLYLFTSAGTLSPQALDRVYSFLDWDGWSGERVVLRPDSTIAAARLYAEEIGTGTAKLCYSQDVFRFTDDDAPRQEWQCGVELIGETGATGDIELVLLALDVLNEVGVTHPVVRLSHAGIVRTVLAAAALSPEEQVAAYDRLLDGDLSVVGEIEARLPQLNAPLHLLFDVVGAGSAYIANIRAALVGAISELSGPLDELQTVVGALERAGVRVTIEAVLARSFEYYSGLVLRIDVDGRRVCAGGRYDDLVALVGGRSVPASGFAFYLSSITALFPVREDAEAAVLIEATDPMHAFDLASQLRSRGMAAETVAGASSASTVAVRGDGTYSIEGSSGARTADSFDELVRLLESER